jgi:hypothetical protein
MLSTCEHPDIFAISSKLDPIPLSSNEIMVAGIGGICMESGTFLCFLKERIKDKPENSYNF